MSEKTLLEYVSDVYELQEISDYIKDPMVDEAMGYVVKLSRKDIPASVAFPLIGKLQAMAAEFSLKAKYYTIFEKGGDNVKKKHVYYTLEEALNNIVNSLKYLVK